MSSRVLCASALLALLAHAQPVEGQSAVTLQAVDLYRASNRAEATARLQSSARSGDPWAYYWLGRMQFLNVPDAAFAQFERAVAMNDSVALFHLWLGRAYGAKAQRASMLQAAFLARSTKSEWERALQLDPRNIEARAELITFHQRAPRVLGGDAAKVETYLQEIRQLSPFWGGMTTAEMAARAKDWTRAEAAYRALVASYPDSAMPVLRLGTILHEQGRLDEAFALYDASLQRQPKSPLVLYGLGKTSALSGKRLDDGQAALTAFLAAPLLLLDEAPTYAGAHFRLGGIAERRGDPARARREYSTALALDPENRPVKEALARLP